MDEAIEKILFDKFKSSSNQNDDVKKLMVDFKKYDPNSFHAGIIVGRLYNSFLYQHRRILKRNPTNDEFTEFVDFIKNNLKSFSE